MHRLSNIEPLNYLIKSNLQYVVVPAQVGGGAA